MFESTHGDSGAAGPRLPISHSVSKAKRRVLGLFASIVTGAFACGPISEEELAGAPEPQEEESGAIARGAQAIAAEETGKADILGERDATCPGSGWCGYLHDAAKTRTGFAAMNSGGASPCSGTWIGPNIFLTNGHCVNFTQPTNVGPFPIVYLSTTNASTVLPQFAGCRMLAQSIQIDAVPAADYKLADAALIWCPDVTVGGQALPPGVIYGYLDFSLHPGTLPNGTSVYSTWWNPVVSLGSTNHLLHGAGTITSNTEVYGFQSTKEYNQNTCGLGGMSGSAMVDGNWHRLAGLTHEAYSPNTSLPCQPGVKSIQARSLFEDWSIPTNATLLPAHQGMTNGWINNASIQTASGGALTDGPYWGKQDKNGDYVFDLQKDLESLRGEAFRDHYWLGFESVRRNAQWTSDSGVSTFYPHQATPPAQPYGILNINTPANKSVLKHNKLPIRVYSRYRLSFKLRTFSAGSPTSLQLVVHQAVGSNKVLPLPTRISSQYERVTVEFESGVIPSGVLELRSTAALSADMQNLVLVEEGSTMDFSTADKRHRWFNYTTNAPSFIVPHAVVNGVPDWALALPRTTGADWSGFNQDLALVPGVRYKICFKRKYYYGAATVSGEAEIHSVRSGASLTKQTFTASSSWTTYCMPEFRAQVDTSIRFGNRGVSGAAAILIDDITIERKSEADVVYKEAESFQTQWGDVTSFTQIGGAAGDQYLHVGNTGGTTYEFAVPTTGLYRVALAAGATAGGNRLIRCTPPRG